jgi:GTP-binding protein EngB required for normal cell division
MTEAETALARVRRSLAAARGLAGLDPAGLNALAARAESKRFNLVAVGEFKRGKSSLINALIGAEVLPMGVVPLTAIATVLEYGATPTVTVAFRDGAEHEVDLAALWDYATEKGNPGNAKGVAEVRIAWPSPWLGRGVRLVDTPGIGSVYRHNTDATYRFLPQADAVLFLLSVDQPVGRAEYDFLGEVRAYAGKVFFLLNKADLLSEAELAESAAFARGVLSEAMGRPVEVFPVSARRALDALHNGEAGPDRSGFPPFTEALDHFLRDGKDTALAAALAKGLSRLAGQARFQAELARAALAAPVEDLRRKLAAFETRRLDMEQEKRDFSVLLEAEVKRLAERNLVADVEAFKAGLAGEVEAAVKTRYEAVHGLPLDELAEDLQHHAQDTVRTGWDRFRKAEDDKLDTAFQALVERFGGRVESIVDELYRYAAELFSVPFEAVRAETAFDSRSGFYYKFWEVPGSLRIMTVSLLHALPKFLGDGLVLKEALKYGRELADTQAGRVRYDFAQRLDKSMRTFKLAMLARIDATLAGISAAVEQGLVLDAANTDEARARDLELGATLARLDRLTIDLKPLVSPEAGS